MAVTLREVMYKLSTGSIIVLIVIFIQFFISTKHRLYGNDIKLFQLSFNKYYAVDQFERIKTFINKPQKTYRVISLGIDPSVSLYNGFYTLDGYMVNYPIQYKHDFRKIIEKSLSENNIYRDIYDGWGSRVYLFDNDVRFAYENEAVLKSTHYQQYTNLNFSTNTLKNMGGEYIFSASPIQHAKKYGLIFLKTFKDPKSLWNISLYKITSTRTHIK